ncbi:MAG: 30S ribosomal protein S13 [candidate division WWE3 bacterium]|nr:30S ribosomal protein S13 [candidate division WWE3 bacterium]
MARLVGVDLPNNKRMKVALTYIYGIGIPNSQKILKEAGISEYLMVKDLTDEDLAKLRAIVEKNHIVTEGELRRTVASNIRRLKDIGSYRGWRHKRNLPSRGQRTRTNARTRRGKKITVGGSGGKKSLEKT